MGEAFEPQSEAAVARHAVPEGLQRPAADDAPVVVEAPGEQIQCALAPVSAERRQHEGGGLAGGEQAVNRAEESAEISKEIAMSTAQQISGSRQISEAMINIDEVMKQIATGAQQSQAAAKQLSDTGKELKELADKFRIVKA